MTDIIVDWGAIGAVPGTFRIELQSHPNPDFGETRPPKPRSLAKGSLLKVVRAARAYSVGLGGGNWGEPIIYLHCGGNHWERFARVSYNGRIWPPAPWFSGMKAMFEKDQPAGAEGEILP